MRRRRPDAAVQYLFVYGSLRPALGQRLQRELERHARWVGSASWQGQLYDLGAYPGAVAGGNPGQRVSGDLYQLRHSTVLLRTLDRYEGVRGALGEYRRQLTEVQCQGRVLAAWIYVYNRSVTRKKRIHSGDYLDRAD